MYCGIIIAKIKLGSPNVLVPCENKHRGNQNINERIGHTCVYIAQVQHKPKH